MLGYHGLTSSQPVLLGTTKRTSSEVTFATGLRPASAVARERDYSLHSRLHIGRHSLEVAEYGFEFGAIACFGESNAAASRHVKYIELAIDDALTHFSGCNDESLFEFVDCAFDSRGRIAREFYNLAK